MWTSQARTSPRNSVCQSSSMISLREKTCPGLSASKPEDLKLRAGQVDRLAAHGDEVAGQVDRYGPRLDRGSLGAGRAVELAAAQLRPHAAEQLADREWLGDVVVGADLEAHDLVDLGVLGGQQDDRDGAVRADLAAEVEAALPGHHDVQDQQVEMIVGDLPLGFLAVRCQGDVEALLLQGVADGLAYRELVVHHQDPARRRRCWAHATGVGVGLAARSRTQKMLPCPGSERRPISPPIKLTMRLAIERPSPKPSPSRVAEPR